ncbi:TrbL/VirB6 family protein [Candidatus Trichorickettsia mobilis]|nr:type IV secretion system protein [Candidatus Trichorickettsia mobilis]
MTSLHRHISVLSYLNSLRLNLSEFGSSLKSNISLLILLVTCLLFPIRALAVPGWLSTSLLGLASLFSKCLEVPEVSNFHYGSKILNLSQSGIWVPTGSQVENGKMIKFDWSTKGVETRPRKYKVMYRIDPRFSQPQVFIQTYDYQSGQYVSDFHQFKNGQLDKYQNKPEMLFQQRTTDYSDYFNFNGRPRIPVYAGDVVNITLIDKGGYFTNSDKFTSEFDDPGEYLSIAYTVSAGMDNKIIYAPAGVWCKFLGTGNSSVICNNGTYKNSGNIYNVLMGRPYESPLSNLQDSCALGTDFNNTQSLCFYDKGRGMGIKIGGQVVKQEQDIFVHSSFNNKDFIYYRSKTSSDLTFTSWPISNMFTKASQLMSGWKTYSQESNLKSDLINQSITDLSAKFLHFGRYTMQIEIGNGDQSVSFEEQAAIKVEYGISSSLSAPSSGSGVSQTTRADAGQAGYLWLRVINPNSQVQGAITVNFANYTGTKWFSDIVYKKAITPLREKFNKLTKQFYSKLVTNATLQRIARLMLILYILLYGLFFLAGATKITVTDIVMRVIKISIIVILFGENSWNFFNDNLFNMFVYGSDYLMANVVDISSSVGNIFGFIDPIFDKYTDGRIWGLLLIQLLQIHNGLTFFAIMTIYSILLYFRAVLEVIINYCLAFVGLAVMISLAPFFITFVLFEQTKSLFNNWMSTLFSYMIQPTILLIFFLLIDQIISTQLASAVTKACWGWLIPIEIGLDLNHLGIPLSFSFKLPFLEGIPFFITEVATPSNINDVISSSGSFMKLVTSSLLFYSYCLMSYGLVEYVTLVVSQLTNVMPARQEGNVQAAGTANQSVMDDLTKVASPVTNTVKRAAAVFKDKVIDQNYSAREDGKSKNYSDKLQSRDEKGSGKGSGKDEN